jgi:hypothetical protein
MYEEAGGASFRKRRLTTVLTTRVLVVVAPSAYVYGPEGREFESLRARAA